ENWNPPFYLGAVDVTVSADDIAFVSDDHFHGVRKYTTSGDYLGSFGSYGVGPGQFIFPHGIVIDGSGNLWVADPLNRRVELLTAGGSYLGEFGSFGTSPGEFNQPLHMALDGRGHIYVTDYQNHRVQKFAID